MYSLVFVVGAKNIRNFENMRRKSFGGGKINDNSKSEVAMDIVAGKSKAYTCYDDDNQQVGGMVISLPEDDKNIVLDFIFTNKEHRNNGAASFMINKLVEDRTFFTEKKYEGIILQSENDSYAFYIHRGFERINRGPMLMLSKKYHY